VISPAKQSSFIEVMGSYKDLEIYQSAYKLAIEIHDMSMKLPKHEFYEQGSQIRRSSKRIKDTIAEGYGRKKYKAEFIRFLIFAHASCDETISQLNMISDIYYKDNPLDNLTSQYEVLGKRINKFIQYVENNWK
jgi:four helix bundle protein